MTSQPKRHRAHYSATLDTGGSAEFGAVRSARAWAEKQGTTANVCTIRDRFGRVIGEHRRDTAGDGTRWFRASLVEA